MAFVPAIPELFDDGIYGMAPSMWYGGDAPNDVDIYFALVAVGSLYWERNRANTTVEHWVKVSNTGAAATDWVETAFLTDIGPFVEQDDIDASILAAVGSDPGLHMHMLEETVAFDDFTDGGSDAGTFVLDAAIPANALFHRAVLVDITGFAGDTSAVLEIGDGTDEDRYNAAAGFDVFADADVLDGGAPQGVLIHDALMDTVTLTVTSATDFGDVSAGEVTVRLYYVL
jgi:hypothetical protein